MNKSADEIKEIFMTTSTRAFAFLETQWSFTHCGIRGGDLGDPRDQEMRSRYQGTRVVVDIALTIAAGLFVTAWRIPLDTSTEICWDLRPTSVIDFDDFLKDQIGDVLPPLFPDLAQPTYLTDMYNQQPRKYIRVVLPRLSEAIEATATRLEKYGSALLSGTYL